MFLIPTYLTVVFYFLTRSRESFNSLDVLWIFWINMLLTVLIEKPLLGLRILICLLFWKPTRIMLEIIGKTFYTLITRDRAFVTPNSVNVMFNYTKAQVPKTPSILLVNYPANHIEYLAPLHFMPVTYMVGAATLGVTVTMLLGEQHVIKIDKETGRNFAQAQTQILEALQRHNVVVYPERNYYKRKTIWHTSGDLRSGIFTIAKDNNIPLIPVYIEHFRHFCGFITNTPRVCVGTPITEPSELLDFWESQFKHDRSSK